MGAEKECRSQPVASGRVCRVARCSHGTLHLTLGALTLRLTPDQLEDLTDTLVRATRQADATEVERPANRLPC